MSGRPRRRPPAPLRVIPERAGGRIHPIVPESEPGLYDARVLDLRLRLESAGGTEQEAADLISEFERSVADFAEACSRAWSEDTGQVVRVIASG